MRPIADRTGVQTQARHPDSAVSSAPPLPLPHLPLNSSFSSSIRIISNKSVFILLQDKYFKNFTVVEAKLNVHSAVIKIDFDLHERHRLREELDFECIAMGFGWDDSPKDKVYPFKYKPSGKKRLKHHFCFCVRP